MTPDVETTLREALDARYALVTPDPAAYDAVLRRRQRRRLTRWAVPVATAAAAVAVVGAVAVVTRPADRARTPIAVPPASPERLVFDRVSESEVSGEAVIATAGSLASVTATPPDLDVAAVTAVGDGETFYAIAGETCRTSLYRVTEAGPEKLAVLPAGWPESMAVTRDGARLAYALRPADEKTCMPVGADRTLTGGYVVLHVRDLATGAERTWRTPEGAFGFETMAWAPDGRTLAYDAKNVILTLDTTGPGGEAPVPDTALRTFGGRGAEDLCGVEAPAYLDDGSLVAGYYCLPRGGTEQETGVARYDVATATIGERLFGLPGEVRPGCLAFDRTGRHAYVCAEPSGSSGDDDRRTLWEWHGAAEATQVVLDRPAPRTVAW